MAYNPTIANLISTANSTTSVLAGAAVFTGTAEDVKDYAVIQVSVIASHASATDGLSIQQSSNNTNWDHVDVYTIPAATGKVYSFAPVARYFRIVYTNGATLQTYFRLQTVFHASDTKPSSQRPGDSTTNENDMSMQSAFMQLFNGTTWDRVRGDITNGLDVDVTRLPALVAGSAIIGKFGVDQTTPGTTNAISVAQIGATTISTGNGVVGAGVQRVAIASDNSTIPVSLASVPSHAVTNAGTFVVQENGASLTALQLIDDTVFVDDAAFTTATSKVMAMGLVADETSTDSVDEGDVGAPRMTLDRRQIVTITPHTQNGLSTYHLVSLATTNLQVVKASPGQLYGWFIYNSNAAARKVVFHNSASTPTAGASVFFSIMIPPTSGANVEFTNGIAFSAGIAISTVTGLLDNDTAAVAASDLIINLFYK